MKKVTEKIEKVKITGKSRLKRVIGLAVALILFVVATNPGTLFFLSEDSKTKLSNMWSSVFGGDVGTITGSIVINWISIFKVIAIILLLSLINNIIRLLLEVIKPKTSKGKSLHSMISSITIYAVMLVGIIWCLSAIGVNLSTIFASIGIVALIIGFAAESLIEDVITGVFLVFEDEFNVGDIIEFGGFRGTVISIGVRVTCIQDMGGNVKVVNNSDIRDVLNRSKAMSYAVVDVPVSYAADLEATEVVIKKILVDIQKLYPEVFTEALNYSGVQEFGESSVNLRVTAHVVEADIYKAQRLMRREIKIGFDKNGVEIPFNQIVVHNGDK